MTSEAKLKKILDKLVEQFLFYLKTEKDASPHTVSSYRLDVNQYVDVILVIRCNQNSAVDQCFTTNIAREYINKLTIDGNVRNSILRKISSARSFCRYLIREGVLEINPFMGLHPPRKSRSLPDIFTVEEVARLLDAPIRYWREIADDSKRPKKFREFISTRDAAILEVIYSAGLRISEVIKLDYADINFDMNS